jgi:type I restriction enzyme S subunit
MKNSHEWRTLRLGYSARMIVPMRDKPPFGGRIPWIRIEDIDGKYIRTSKTGQAVSPETVSEMSLKVFPVGTVLCSCSCTMGTTAIVREPLVSNQTFIGIVSGPDLSPEFLYYALQSASESLQSTATGAIQQYLSRDDFQRLRLRVPGLPLQREISGFLDHHTRNIDDLIARKQRLIELLNEKRAAIVSRAVTQGLDPNAPMKESGVQWLGRVPTHWHVPKAKYLSRIFVPARDKPNLSDSGDFAWITLDEVRSNDSITGSVASRWVDLGDLKASGGRVLRSGSVIASCVGEFGLSAIALDSCVINQQLQAYSNPVLDAEFMRYCVEVGRPYFESVSTSTTIRYVNQDRFGGFPVPQPPREEQVGIVSYLRRLESETKDMKQKVSDVIDRLREYRAALITAAVAGKFDIRELQREVETLT